MIRRFSLLIAFALLAAVLSVSMAGAADSWSFVYGDPDPDSFSSADAVAYGPDGSVYVAGVFFGTFEGVTPVDEFDLFLMKLGANGGVEWLRTVDSDAATGDLSGSGNGTDLLVDRSGNVFWSYNSEIRKYTSTGVADGLLIRNKLWYWSRGTAGDGFLTIESTYPGPYYWTLYAYDADMNHVWSTPLDIPFGPISATALPDGSVIVWENRPPEFSFQSYAQELWKYSPTGSLVWSVRHGGRCSPDIDYSRAHSLQFGDVVLIYSQPATGNSCVDGNYDDEYAAYSVDSGELLRAGLSFGSEVGEPWGPTRPLFVMCGVDGDPTATPPFKMERLIGGDDPCPGDDSAFDWGWHGSATPSVQLGSVAYGIGESAGCSSFAFVQLYCRANSPALIQFAFDPLTGFEIIGGALLAMDGELVVRDVAIGPDGQSSVVGRAGSTAVISGHGESVSGPVSEAGTTEGRATVVQNLIPPPPPRYAGSNRFGTAAAISAGEFPDPGAVDRVFVATGVNYPDALAGAAVAGGLHAPLLLVSATGVPGETAAELTRLDPATIVILGGEAVVSPGVAAQLGAYGSVVRLAGSNRYATAVEISKYGFPAGADQVVIATGTGFADALAGGPLAAKLGGPVLLTDPKGLPAVVAAEITRLNPSRIVVLGGTAVVPEAVVTQLKALQPNTVRVAGTNRYSTSVAISQAGFSSASRVYVATGLNFPDALAGAAAAAANGAPVLLIPGTSVPGEVAAEITRLGATQIFILGGAAAVSHAAATTLGGLP